MSEEKKARRYFTAKEMRYLRLKRENLKSEKPVKEGELLRMAGYSEHASPGAINDQITKVLSSHEELKEKLEEAGLGVDSIVDDIGRLGKAQTKLGQDDNATQLGVLNLKADIFDVRAPKRVQVDKRTAIFHLTPEVIENIKKIKGEAELQRLLLED